MDTKQYEETHPWIRFQIDLTSISPPTWMLLGEARSKCEHIKGVPLEPETAQQLLRLYLAKGALATTAIEGNTLSEEQVLQHLRGELELPPSQEYLQKEIDNIVSASNEIWAELEIRGAQPITPEMIARWNLMVLDGLELEEGVVPGQIRTDDVVVGGGIYKGAPPGDCEYLLKELCNWLNGPQFISDDPGMKTPLAIIKAIIGHLYIAWIHPFGDGNGRTARLLEVYVLSAAGVPKPAAHLLSNHYNQTRPKYYRSLRDSSLKGRDERGFIAYAIEGLVEGLLQQLAHIRSQQWDVAWENFVHRTFQSHDDSAVGRRRRKLILALGQNAAGGVPNSQLRALSPEIAEAYASVSNRTLYRDVEELEKMELVSQEARGIIRARKETILAFLPSTVEEIAAEETGKDQ